MKDKISNIKERVLQIPEYKGITKQEFFKKIGMSYGNFTGKSKLTPLNSNAISNISTIYPDISLEWLINGRGEMLKLPFKYNDRGGASEFSEPVVPYGTSPKVITVAESGSENIILVPYKARAGYLAGYEDPRYIKSLPAYRFPNLSNGTFRMFEVKGFSMMPTLHDGSMVIGQYVENPIKDIKDDRVYIIITHEHGISVKRVLNRIKKYGNLYCKSDNRAEFPPFTVALEEIQEVWEYKSHLSFNVPNPADLFDRINNMEAEIYQLQDQIKVLNKKENS